MLCQYYYKTAVHKVDGPNQGQTYTSPQSGRTPPMVKLIQVHEMARPNQGHKLTQVHKVDEPHQGSRPAHKIDEPTSVKTYPQSGRAQPLSTYINPRSGRTLQGVKTNPQNGRTQPGPSLSAE